MVPSAPTATSRAAMPGISATLICQLKPSGAVSGWIAEPIMAARVLVIGGGGAPSGACGKLARNQIRIIIEAMVVPARLRKAVARPHRPMARLLARGIL